MVVCTRFRGCGRADEASAGNLERGGPVVGVRTSTDALDFPVGSAWRVGTSASASTCLGNLISHHGHQLTDTRDPGAWRAVTRSSTASATNFCRGRGCTAVPGSPAPSRCSPARRSTRKASRRRSVAWTRRQRHGAFSTRVSGTRRLRSVDLPNARAQRDAVGHDGPEATNRGGRR